MGSVAEDPIQSHEAGMWTACDEAWMFLPAEFLNPVHDYGLI